MADDRAPAPPALREEEAFLALAETLSALIVLIQGDKLVYVNPAGAALLGYPQDYYKGRNFWDFALPEDREAIVARGRARQIGIDQPRRFTERLRHADGRVLWVDYSVDVIRLNGKTTTLVTGHDITERKRNEDALRQSETLFRGLFKQSPVMMCSVGKDHEIREVSDHFLAKLGYLRHELVGQSSWKYLAPESIQQFRTVIEEKRKRREYQVKDLPLKMYRKDGSVMDILLSSVAELDENGEPKGWITVAHDLSEINEAQRARLQSEERFQAAFQNAAIGKAITDGDRRLTQVNRAFCAMLGYTEAELLGKTPYEITHPDDHRQTQEFVKDILSCAQGSARQTKRYLHKSGRPVWVDMTATLVRDDQGRPSYYVTEIQDITERKEAERALEASEERFRTAFENAAIGKAITSVYVPSRRIEFLQVNQAFCEMLGYTKRELVGASPAALTHPDDRAESQELVRRLISGKATSSSLIKRYLHRNGSTVWASLTTTLIRDSEGRPAFFVTEVVDITERKLAEEQLRDREAKLNEAQKIAKIGSWRYDIASNTSVWSDEMYRIFDVDPLAFNPSKENAYARFHPEDLRRVAKVVERAIADGEPFEFDARLPHRDGTVLHLHAIGRANRDDSGKPATLYGTLQDVTERRRAVEVMRDREAKLAEAQRIAHIGSWEWDLASNQISWSDEVFRILGLDPAVRAAGYEAYMSRIHPEDRADLQFLVDRAIREGLPYESEHRILRDSGELRSLWASGRLDLDDSGKPVRLYGITQDITERKQAEEALRASEQRFRNLYSQAPVMMTAMDPDGKIREVSNYWLKVMGYAREEVIGHEGFRFVTPDSKLILDQGLAETLLSGERVVRNLPIVGVRKDGSTVDILITSVLEMEPDGKPVGAIAVGIDVSDIRRAEEAVRESEARYRALVEHAPEAIMVLDVESGKYIDVNAKAENLFGYSRDQLLAKGPLDISPSVQLCGRLSSDVAWEQIGRVMRGETVVLEFVHTHSSGHEIPCEVRLSRMPATGQNLIRATITDISDKKTLQEKVRHAEKMAAVGLLAAGVAHEIGNPLLALSMAAQSLERRFADEYAQKKLGLIREHIDRISKIVRQMSDLARPQSAQRSPCDVNRILERAVEIVRYDKRAQEVPIRFESGPDVPLVRGVEDQLMQVCLNLALNALDAVAANPAARPKSLRVFARKVARDGRTYVRASFLDSGPGIPEEARPKIFQPFFTTKGTGKGTGLGLSVSYRIIEEHQGALAFDCRPAEGTEFYFDLPVEEKS
jgi:PAS domain S-box-containing protein